MTHKSAFENYIAMVATIGFPILIVLVVLSFYKIHELQSATSLGSDAALNAEFFNGTNAGIIYALELDKPILIEHKGEYTDAQLDDYLNDMNDINAAYDDGVLTEAGLCDSYSYYVYISASNSEVNNYINSKGTDFYEGLSDLYGIVKGSKDSDCHD